MGATMGPKPDNGRRARSSRASAKAANEIENDSTNPGGKSHQRQPIGGYEPLPNVLGQILRVWPREFGQEARGHDSSGYGERLILANRARAIATAIGRQVRPSLTRCREAEHRFICSLRTFTIFSTGFKRSNCQGREHPRNERRVFPARDGFVGRAVHDSVGGSAMSLERAGRRETLGIVSLSSMFAGRPEAWQVDRDRPRMRGRG